MPTNPANPNLEKIIKVTQAQYATLEGGGTVGDYTGLNDNYLYLIQDDTDVVTSVNNILPVNGNVTLSIPPTVSGVNDGTNWTTITIGSTTKNIPNTYVRYDINNQGLTTTQQSNARTNIGAGTSNFTGYTSSNKLSDANISYGSETANTVFAAPNGSNGSPTYRSLVSADIPTLSASKISGGVLDVGKITITPESGISSEIIIVDDMEPQGLTSETTGAKAGDSHYLHLGTNPSGPGVYFADGEMYFLSKQGNIYSFESDNIIPDYTLATTEYVQANPSTTSATLSSIKIGDTNYTISGGGGGGNLPTTTTANKALLSTTTSGTVKWSDFSTEGFLKTDNTGVLSSEAGTIIKDITSQYVRITDLESGIYRLSRGTSGIYYNGSSDTTKIAYLNSSYPNTVNFLYVTKYQSYSGSSLITYSWDWHGFGNASGYNNAVIYGNTTTSSGTYHTFNYSNFWWKYYSSGLQLTQGYDTTVDSYKLYVPYASTSQIGVSKIGNGITLDDSTHTISVNEMYRSYGVSASSPYFTRLDGNGKSIQTITTNISEAYNSSTSNWGVLYEYFRQTIFGLGSYADGGSGEFQNDGPLTCAGLFIAYNDNENNIGPQITENTKWMSDNLLSYFTLATTQGNIDSYKVELLGGYASMAECTLKITLYTKDTQEYSLQITSLWNGNDNVYWTDGWHLVGGSGTKLQTTTEWQNTSLYNALSGFNTSAGCSTSSFYKSTLWSLTDIAGITEPYNGMKIVIRVPLAGVGTAGTLLSIDGGTTYHPVAYNVNTVLTTHYAVNSNKVFIYNANQTMNGYLTMNAVTSKPSDWSTNYTKYYRKTKSATKSYDWTLNTSDTWDATTYDYAKGNTATSFTGVWQGESNYYSDANSIGYQLRTNSALWANKTYNGSTGYSMNRYTLLFEVAGGLSGAATSIGTGTSKVTIPFKYIPGGVIKYYSTSGAIAINDNFGATGLWDQYAIDLRYTFNIGSTLTSGKPVYMKMSVNSDGTLSPAYSGSPSHPIVQDLPSSVDNYVYVFLGQAYSTYNIELYNNHPIYCYRDGKIQLWSGIDTNNVTKYNTSDTTQAQNIRILTQSEYNNLGTKDSNTVYLIKAS